MDFQLSLWIFDAVTAYIITITVSRNILTHCKKKQDILRKKYPYNCFVMTMYQSLLMALVSLPFCVLES